MISRLAIISPIYVGIFKVIIPGAFMESQNLMLRILGLTTDINITTNSALII